MLHRYSKTIHLILYCLLLSEVCTGKNCDIPCQCCKVGSCTYGQEKCQGCIDGYSGDKCNIPCPPNCVNCSQTYFTSEKVCPACKDGFYNGHYQDQQSYSLQENCALSCKTGCMWCASFNSCLKCKEGYFLTPGQECSACPNNCKNCNTETSCIKCQESYYWDEQATKCQHCGFHCKACKSFDTCSECENGFYLEGNVCEICHEGCMSCDEQDKCSICHRGYYLLKDRCSPCKSHCNDCEYSVQSSYVCKSCDNRHFLFGNTCNGSCGEGCLDCLTNTQCNTCEKEYFKQTNRCFKCPVKCLSCSSEENCTQCVSGYHGDHCSLPCPSNCNECQLVDGTCVSCKTGYFLNDLKVCLRCPLNCDECLTASDCLVCKPGYKGTSCQEKCDKCRPATKCDKNTGYCYDACQDGLGGTYCNINCSLNCLSCERHNSEKCFVCAANHFGSDCASKCPLHCKSNACVEVNGRCTLGCEVGHWGNQCDINCYSNCNGTICDQRDGTCTVGCKDNSTDNNCKCSSKCNCGFNDSCESCEKGWYGNLCKNRCSTGCADSECFKQNGTCLQACVNGYMGNNCKVSIEISTDFSTGLSKTASTALVISGVISLNIIVGAVIVYIVNKLRRRIRQERPSSPTPRASEAENGDDKNYTTIQDNVMEPKPTGTYTPLLDVPLSQDDASKDYNKLEPVTDSQL